MSAAIERRRCFTRGSRSSNHEGAIHDDAATTPCVAMAASGLDHVGANRAADSGPARASCDARGPCLTIAASADHYPLRERLARRFEPEEVETCAWRPVIPDAVPAHLITPGPIDARHQLGHDTALEVEQIEPHA